MTGIFPEIVALLSTWTFWYSEEAMHVFNMCMEIEVPLSVSKWRKTHNMPLVGFKENLSTKLVG